MLAQQLLESKINKAVQMISASKRVSMLKDVTDPIDKITTELTVLANSEYLRFIIALSE